MQLSNHTRFLCTFMYDNIKSLPYIINITFKLHYLTKSKKQIIVSIFLISA